MAIFRSLRAWARRLKLDALTLWFAWRHPLTPRWIKGLCLFVVAYALSPIDLIPDFVPILGYLDDAIVLPALIWLALRLLPPRVLQTCRAQAQEWAERHLRRPRMWAGAALVVLVWLIALWLCWRWWQG
ncbi:YkvA family protein [Uliginosibacterium sp. H3]|uniref:YkvA family protein n=1 Tax=Uliginosibacterium silvisoli TaxID=3114758 RepID=A0ABU6JZH8_9RHOO|nr:YkvA family protein [Uliginosibacterium sp. H3]